MCADDDDEPLTSVQAQRGGRGRATVHISEAVYVLSRTSVKRTEKSRHNAREQYMTVEGAEAN